jgi:hypothetical protein
MPQVQVTGIHVEIVHPKQVRPTVEAVQKQVDTTVERVQKLVDTTVEQIPTLVIGLQGRREGCTRQKLLYQG